MRRSVIALALAGALLSGWAAPAGAQQDGIVIVNNGVDSYDTAAGASNVRISENPGNSQSIEGAGLNNEVGVVEREPRARDRKNRGAPEGEAAPVEAAPAEGDYQAYTDPGYVPEEGYAAPAEAAQPADVAAAPIKLPNTGVGEGPTLPLAALAAGLAALGFGAISARRRFTV